MVDKFSKIVSGFNPFLKFQKRIEQMRPAALAQKLLHHHKWLPNQHIEIRINDEGEYIAIMQPIEKALLVKRKLLENEARKQIVQFIDSLHKWMAFSKTCILVQFFDRTGLDWGLHGVFIADIEKN